VVRVGFGSVRGKGRQGGSLGRGVFLRIWNFPQSTHVSFERQLCFLSKYGA
jgi:hypothetical protein